MRPLDQQFELIREENLSHIDRFWDLLKTTEESFKEANTEFIDSSASGEVGRLTPNSEKFREISGRLNEIGRLIDEIEGEKHG